MCTFHHLNGREYVLGTNRSIRRYQDLDTITFIQFYLLHLQIYKRKKTRVSARHTVIWVRVLGRSIQDPGKEDMGNKMLIVPLLSEEKVFWRKFEHYQVRVMTNKRPGCVAIDQWEASLAS